jgi:hypothetical protein
VKLPGDTTEDGDRRAASSNGDVQAADIDAEQSLDETRGDRVDRARVLNVLAALSARRAAAATGGYSERRCGESEGDEGLGELHDGC